MNSTSLSGSELIVTSFPTSDGISWSSSSSFCIISKWSFSSFGASVSYITETSDCAVLSIEVFCDSGTILFAVDFLNCWSNGFSALTSSVCPSLPEVSRAIAWNSSSAFPCFKILVGVGVSSIGKIWNEEYETGVVQI